MSRPDGGPAFPHLPISSGSLDATPDYCGMTLRDYFAAKAMAGILQEPRSDDEFIRQAGVALLAYQLADAMLAERSKP